MDFKIEHREVLINSLYDLFLAKINTSDHRYGVILELTRGKDKLKQQLRLVTV
jgi:hypothetical protein